eukprot:84065-Chlamydomonas_euryale.AAC.2
MGTGTGGGGLRNEGTRHPPVVDLGLVQCEWKCAEPCKAIRADVRLEREEYRERKDGIAWEEGVVCPGVGYARDEGPTYAWMGRRTSRCTVALTAHGLWGTWTAHGLLGAWHRAW